MIAVAILHPRQHPERRFGPTLWIAVLAATGVENVIGVLAVSTAISLAEGTRKYRRMPEMLKIGTLVSLTNASLALMAVTVFWLEPRAALLFVVRIVTAAVAYRAYVAERQQHEELEMLYESTRILQRNPQMASALVTLLEHARADVPGRPGRDLPAAQREGDDVLRTAVGPGDCRRWSWSRSGAVHDELLLRAIVERQGVHRRWAAAAPTRTTAPARRPVMVAPLNGETRLIGRWSRPTGSATSTRSTPSDLRLFETLANHTAVALENGQLEQSLRSSRS